MANSTVNSAVNSAAQDVAKSETEGAAESAAESITDAVASPCVSICALDGDDLCVGCFRTGNEISYWGRLPASSQREVLMRSQQRMAGQPALCVVAQARRDGRL